MLIVLCTIFVTKLKSPTSTIILYTNELGGPGHMCIDPWPMTSLWLRPGDPNDLYSMTSKHLSNRQSLTCDCYIKDPFDLSYILKIYIIYIQLCSFKLVVATYSSMH